MFLNKRENATIEEMEFIIALQRVIIYYEGDVLRDPKVPAGKKDLIRFMMLEMRKELTDSLSRIKHALNVEERVKELMDPMYDPTKDPQLASRT